MKKLLPIMIAVLFLGSSFIGISRPVEKESSVVEEIVQPTTDGQLEHIWPTQGYNRKHVGRSPYSTETNPGVEKWRYPVHGNCEGSPVIGFDGIIYVGSSIEDKHLYAIYPNGTLKWKFHTISSVSEFGSHPAIDEDGTIYIPTTNYIQAINPNGTEKWNYKTSVIHTSITLGNEGIIYYGHSSGLHARYPNGTLKWSFHTEGELLYVMSTPAVDDSGVVYFGSHDTYIYAVYPNGTMKWKFETGNWVHGSPCIGTDGTIYCGSGDYYLYALYPNGTLKWKTETGSQRSSPSQDKEENLYFGVWENKVYSVSPDGTIRWEFTIGNRSGVWGSTVAISDDETIYIGACIEIGSLGGGEIIALDLNGNLKWRKTICDSVLCSSPVISEDGTIYIGSSSDKVGGGASAYLHAFGNIENNQPPETPTIDGPVEGEVRKSLKYIVKADDFDKTPVSYYFDWGDGTDRQTVDYEPGISIPIYHMWERQGPYTIKVKAIDTFGLESDWATLEITIPRNKPFLDMFQIRFPLLYELFNQIYGRNMLSH